ncbi:hypothetical protein ABPG75_000728 [Micractinium tetrahymenae]
MAESSDPTLYTRRAKRGTGANAVEGVCMITRSRVKWQPSDRSKGEAAVIDIGAITRTQQAPGKPFIKLDTAVGALVLGFESVADRDDAVDLLRQLKPPAGGAGSAAGSGGGSAGGKGASPGAGGGKGAAPTAGGKLLLPSDTQRAALFKADPDLGTLYKSLVVAGILGEAEFWSTRQGLLRGGGGGGGGGVRKQRVGLPSAMLADVKPSADGQTEKVHFQLTPEIIQQIFTERPEVHRAFLAHVPHNLDEKAFWTRYFKQQYRRMARRRRQGLPMDGGDDEDEDELFAPFRKSLQEQERQRAKAEVGRVDPTVNLAADAGEHFASGGFGSARDGTRDPAAALRSTHLGAIARDINRHAAVVLGGAPDALDRLREGSTGGAGGGAAAADTARIAAALAEQQTAAAKAAAARAAKGKAPVGGAAAAGQGEAEEVSPERLAEWQTRAASALDDLRLDDRESSYMPLNIQDPRAYFDAGTGAAAAAAATGADGKLAAKQADGSTAAAAAAIPSAAGTAAAAGAGALADGGTSALLAALAAVQPAALPNPPCDPGLAEQVLLELCQDQDASLVQEFGPVAAAALQYPPHDKAHGLLDMLIEHFRGEALKANELLRHFWGNLPLVSAARAERANKLACALQEQRAILVPHMRHPAGEGTSHQVYTTMMLRPLVAAIDAALARHQAEQQQRRKAPP